jgi:hypothetical protein
MTEYLHGPRRSNLLDDLLVLANATQREILMRPEAEQDDFLASLIDQATIFVGMWQNATGMWEYTIYKGSDTFHSLRDGKKLPKSTKGVGALGAMLFADKAAYEATIERLTEAAKRSLN